MGCAILLLADRALPGKDSFIMVTLLPRERSRS